MFARPYSTVAVCVAHQQPQRWTVPADEAHDFAADRYAHYSNNLGAYAGTNHEDGTTYDYFEHGVIMISYAR